MSTNENKFYLFQWNKRILQRDIDPDYLDNKTVLNSIILDILKHFCSFHTDYNIGENFYEYTDEEYFKFKVIVESFGLTITPTIEVLATKKIKDVTYSEFGYGTTSGHLYDMITNQPYKYEYKFITNSIREAKEIMNYYSDKSDVINIKTKLCISRNEEEI